MVLTPQLEIYWEFLTVSMEVKDIVRPVFKKNWHPSLILINKKRPKHFVFKCENLDTIINSDNEILNQCLFIVTQSMLWRDGLNASFINLLSVETV